jgi:hypothetical protein
MLKMSFILGLIIPRGCEKEILGIALVKDLSINV